MALTGNPQLDDPALKAAMIQKLALKDPTQGTQGPQLGNLRQPPTPEPANISLQPPSVPVPQIGQQRPNVSLAPQPKGTLIGDKQALSEEASKKPFLEDVYGKIRHSSFGENHPKIGALLGGLAQIPATATDIAASGVAPRLGALIPGTSVNRGLKLQGLENRIAGEEKGANEEAQAAYHQAQIPLTQAEAAEHTAKAEAAEPIEVSEQQAQALGMPELAGEKVSGAVLARLSGVNQGNVTKKDVAGIGAESREKVAGINQEGKQKSLDEKVREFGLTDTFRHWKTAFDNATKERIAQLTASKAPAAMLQTAEFATGGLNMMADAEAAMSRLEQKGVLGSNVAQNKVEDWIFGKGLVDPSLDEETRRDIGRVRAALGYTSSAAMRAHTGRTSREIYDDFKTRLGVNQDWSALKGALDETSNMLGHYADAASTQNIENLRSGNHPAPQQNNPPEAPATQPNNGPPPGYEERDGPQGRGYYKIQPQKKGVKGGSQGF